MRENNKELALPYPLPSHLPDRSRLDTTAVIAGTDPKTSYVLGRSLLRVRRGQVLPIEERETNAVEIE